MMKTGFGKLGYGVSMAAVMGGLIAVTGCGAGNSDRNASSAAASSETTGAEGGMMQEAGMMQEQGMMEGNGMMHSQPAMAQPAMAQPAMASPEMKAGEMQAPK